MSRRCVVGGRTCGLGGGYLCYRTYLDEHMVKGFIGMLDVHPDPAVAVGSAGPAGHELRSSDRGRASATARRRARAGLRLHAPRSGWRSRGHRGRATGGALEGSDDACASGESSIINHAAKRSKRLHNDSPFRMTLKSRGLRRRDGQSRRSPMFRLTLVKVQASAVGYLGHPTVRGARPDERCWKADRSFEKKRHASARASCGQSPSCSWSFLNT